MEGCQRLTCRRASSGLQYFSKTPTRPRTLPSRIRWATLPSSSKTFVFASTTDTHLPRSKWYVQIRLLLPLLIVLQRNIRTQAQDTIYEATRTSFMMMHIDIVVCANAFCFSSELIVGQQKLRDNKVTLKLNSIFGNPSREKALVSVVKKTSSSVRNALRQDVCADFFSKAPC